MSKTNALYMDKLQEAEELVLELAKTLKECLPALRFWDEYTSEGEKLLIMVRETLRKIELSSQEFPYPDYGINLSTKAQTLTIRPEKDAWERERYSILDQEGAIYAATYNKQAAELIVVAPHLLSLVKAIQFDPYSLSPDQWRSEANHVIDQLGETK